MSTLGEWTHYLLRWSHLIAGISWIGNSFYFMWLDAHLVAPQPPREGVASELWMVHSGGFYRVEKRKLGPGSVPPLLHWFKWEATFTLLTGLFLLSLLYYADDGMLLLDPGVSSLTAGQGAAIGVAFLVASWFLYDVLWRSALGRSRNVGGALSALALCGATFGMCSLFSGRGAYIHVGAALGTIMVLNVWVRILPAQRQMIRATQEGRAPDPLLGAEAKKRSVHNSYMTLPVLFLMVSNHFPMTYGHRWNGLVLILLTILGMGTRHLMIVGRRGLWAVLPLVAALAALIWLTEHP
jgi:uncharacterized membrane protein